MFKILFLVNLIFLLVLFPPVIKAFVFAASSELDGERVLVRAGKHSDFVRIVFTLSEETSKHSSATTINEKLIKVAFPRPVTLVASQQGTEKIIIKGEGFIELIKGLKIISGSHFCLIQIDKFDNFKLSRLNAPPRIVIDAYHGAETPSKTAPQKPVSQSSEPIAKQTFNSFVIDPGHGGYDKGIYDENNREKDIALNISKEMAQILTAAGKRAVLTRKADQRLSIKQRIGLANSHSHDIFLSMHISANYECIIYTYSAQEENPPGNGKRKTSEDVAGSLINSLKKDFTFNIRHEKLPLPILKNISSPALLIELPHFKHFSYDKKNREVLIKSLIKGLAAPPAN
jgi:N-acetylmuramoyl-L-alanine amidase